MPSNSKRPFGRGTVKLHATFVPDGAEDKVSRADIAAAVGPRSVKVPAVLVPEGEPSPGRPYVSVGAFEFRLDEDGDTNQPGSRSSGTATPVQGSGDSQ